MRHPGKDSVSYVTWSATQDLHHFWVLLKVDQSSMTDEVWVVSTIQRGPLDTCMHQ